MQIAIALLSVRSCFLFSGIKEAAVLPRQQRVTLWRGIFEVSPGVQSFRVLFERNTVKTLSVLTLVVELCEHGALLTASVMSPGLPQPELRPEDEYPALL